jgi:iron-sulfur cluster repair protein YtfE (RIC family)
VTTIGRFFLGSPELDLGEDVFQTSVARRYREMLTRIGQQSRAQGDLVDLLQECHERIRSFVSLARTAGERVELPDHERVDACLRVERYFIHALPLHVADEEESVEPCLRGSSPEVDRALALMERQHREHEGKVRALLSASSCVRQDPADRGRGAMLVVVAEKLEKAFEEHLVMEETVLFPAVRALPTLDQAGILEQLRARRGPR